MSPVYSQFSNESSGTPPAAPVLTRTVSGLIFRDDFERAIGAPGANWDIISGSWALAASDLGGTVLRANPAVAAAIRVAPAVFGAARAEMVVQVDMRRQGTTTAGGDTPGDDAFPSLQHRIDANNNYQVVETNSGVWSAAALYKVVVGVATLLDDEVSGNSGPLGKLRYKLSRKANYQRSWYEFGGLRTLIGADAALVAAAEATLACAWLGGSTSWAEFDNFAVYKNNRIRMTGLPAGHKMRIVNRYQPANSQQDIVVVESGGVAVAELEHQLCPLVRDQPGTPAKVELLTAGDVLVAEITPPDGVWGGDEYTYA